MLFYTRLFVTTLLLFFIVDSFAQAPGYLGQRIFVDVNIGPEYGITSEQTSTGTRTRSVLKPSIHLAINYVTSRYRYMAIEADYQQLISTRDELLEFPGQPSLKFRVETYAVGFGFYRTYKRRRANIRTLAPIGFFYGYKFSYGKSRANPVRFADSNERFEGAERAAYNLLFDQSESNLIGAAFSAGYRTVVKDKLTLGYSFDIGYRFLLDNTFRRTQPFNIEDLRRSNPLYVNLTIGVGILL